MESADPTGGVLVLGGTAEARQLATMLDRLGVLVTSSLAGRPATAPAAWARFAPAVSAGRTGSGAGWLTRQMAAVIDATHPFAHRISASAAMACGMTGLPLARLDRPPWTEQTGDRWHRVDDLAAAAEVAPRLGRRILLTIGRQQVSAFAAVADAWFLIPGHRAADRPVAPRPCRCVGARTVHAGRRTGVGRRTHH